MLKFSDGTRPWLTMLFVFSSFTAIALYQIHHPYSPGNIIVFPGFLPLIWSLYSSYLCLKTKNWSKVQGKITQSTVNIGRSELLSSAYAVEKFYPRIHYRYQWGDRVYSSSRLGSADDDYGFIDEEDAKAFNQKFSNDQTVDVWVNPEHPDHSVILQGCSKEKVNHITGYGFIGIALIGFGIFVVVG